MSSYMHNGCGIFSYPDVMGQEAEDHCREAWLMNLLRKLFGGGETPDDRLTPNGKQARRVTVTLTDAASYQPALHRLARGVGPDGTVTVAIIPERHNPHNPNAICVRTASGENIGYFSPEDAKRFRPAIERLERRGITLRCQARLVTGTPDDPTLVRVELDLDRPEDLR